MSARKEGKPPNTTGLHISRGSEADFRRFLLAWADWIAASGIAESLSKEPSLAA